MRRICCCLEERTSIGEKEIRIMIIESKRISVLVEYSFSTH